LKKRALISVFDKAGIIDFSDKLVKLDFEIVSTGGTYKLLKSNNIPVKSVEEITNFPEVLDGRVKTLNPNIFSGILAIKNNTKHLEEIKKHNLLLFDLVVVSLYPFEETLKKPDSKPEDIIEMIDIGGVSLIRAAAKNYEHTTVLTSENQYKEFIDIYMDNGNKIPVEYSKYAAYLSFAEIAKYDIAIQNYFKSINILNKYCSETSEVPEFITLDNPYHLRYGENPHQYAVLFRNGFDDIFAVLHGKELSYNNLLDVDAALNIINDFESEPPTCAIIKHGNPSGIATAEELKTSYLKAFETDTVSPFGGIIIFNKKLDLETTIEADKIFTEIILAPDYEEEALNLLKQKKNRRLLKYKFVKNDFLFRSITGGILKQENDSIIFNKSDLKCVTDSKPDDKIMKDFEFAYKIVKHTKSNAIVFIKDLQTLGIGAGQPSRVDSTKLAVSKAKQFGLNLKDSVVASDAFFPFPDGIVEIANAGGKFIIQPGGSVRDNEVLETANKLGLCMVFTGIRHFRH
jgi:phosphoribosylaminoimidazolecarboxamide formyltransferase/IMP cyclohydrolase